MNRNVILAAAAGFAAVTMVFLPASSLAADDPVFKTLYIQGDKVNIRADQNASSPVIIQMKTPDYCDVIGRGKEDTIGGKRDFWYNIKFVDNKKWKTGWVFGAFTSLKLAGRKTVVMKFDSCDGDMLEHRIFIDRTGKKWDFYDQGDNFSGYELCESAVTDDGLPRSVALKKYAGKSFTVILNDLMVYPSCFGDPEECKKARPYSRPSVIFMKLMK